MTMNRKEFLTWTFFLLSSLVSGIYLIFVDHSFDNYQYIGFLPLAFCVCTIVFANVYTVIGKNIGVLCLHAMMFIRLVISPTLMSLSGYDSIFRGVSESEVNYAIILMAYECVMVYLVLGIMTFRGKNKSRALQHELEFQKPNTLFRLAVWGMALYCLAVWFVIPTVRDLYKTVFEFGDLDFTSADYNQNTERVGSLARSLQTLFKLFFDIVRVVLPK